MARDQRNQASRGACSGGSADMHSSAHSWLQNRRFTVLSGGPAVARQTSNTRWWGWAQRQVRSTRRESRCACCPSRSCTCRSPSSSRPRCLSTGCSTAPPETRSLSCTAAPTTANSQLDPRPHLWYRGRPLPPGDSSLWASLRSLFVRTPLDGNESATRACGSGCGRSWSSGKAGRRCSARWKRERHDRAAARPLLRERGRPQAARLH